MKNINLDLVEKLEEEGYHPDSAIIAMVMLIYGLKPQSLAVGTYLPHMLTKYLTREGDTIIPKYRIFNEIPNGTESIDFVNISDEIRRRFNRIKPGIIGDKGDLYKKMKRFLLENPTITRDEILKGVEYYLGTTPEMYLRRANYFVYKQIGKSEVSDLSRCIDEYKNLDKQNKESSNFLNEDNNYESVF